MPTYTHTTKANLISAIQYRLGDTGGVYWSSDEVWLYAQESLRCWGLLTGYWRDFGVFNTSANEAFYSLLTIVGSDGTSLLSQSVTDTNLVKEIEYHLLEPASGTAYTGSEQFTLTDITAALQKRRDKFLVDTATVITRITNIALGPPPVNRMVLPDTVASIRRLAFHGAVSGNITPLWPTDISSQRNYDTGYMITSGDPGTFSTVAGRPQEVVFAPPLSEPGTLEALSVSSGATLNPATGVVMGVPDDCAWVVKYGALADLLGRDGPSRDGARAAFCERRYRLGVELAKLLPVVIHLEVNGQSIDPDTISNLDAFNLSWQTSLGAPTLVAAFPNMVALSPVPNGIYSVTAEVVRKAPIPADGEYVQVGREYLDAIVDYACHIAMFKMGGEEHLNSYRAAQNFFDAALGFNERLSAQNSGAVALMRQSKEDEVSRSYRLPGGLGTLQDRVGLTAVNDPRQNE